MAVAENAVDGHAVTEHTVAEAVDAAHVIEAGAAALVGIANDDVIALDMMSEAGNVDEDSEVVSVGSDGTIVEFDFLDGQYVLQTFDGGPYYGIIGGNHTLEGEQVYQVSVVE
jgi:hypothetical protein